MFNLRRKKEKNLLTMVPLLREKVRFEESNDEPKLIIARDNSIERFSIRFLKQPPVRKVKLDTFGAFVIAQIETKITVDEIGTRIKDTFGNEAEPTLPRLVKFLETLEIQEWIHWKESI